MLTPPEARYSNVGNKSSEVTTSCEVIPALTVPGIQETKGIRKPPSKLFDLPPKNKTVSAT